MIKINNKNTTNLLYVQTKVAFVICSQWHGSSGLLSYRRMAWVECSNYTFSCLYRRRPFFIYGKSKAFIISICSSKIACDHLSVL